MVVTDRSSSRTQTITQSSQSTLTSTDVTITTPGTHDTINIGSLSAVLDRIDDEFVATDVVTGMYGEGDTEPEALSSLMVSLRNLRTSLREHKGTIAPDLAGDLAYLNRILWP
jgi:hypothetical protein